LEPEDGHAIAQRGDRSYRDMGFGAGDMEAETLRQPRGGGSGLDEPFEGVAGTIRSVVLHHFLAFLLLRSVTMG